LLEGANFKPQTLKGSPSGCPSSFSLSDTMRGAESTFDPGDYCWHAPPTPIMGLHQSRPTLKEPPMTRTATGYGPDYEHAISKACAQTLMGTAQLPRLGFEIQIAKHNTDPDPLFNDPSYLYVQNISGRYYLACTTYPKECWPRIFSVLIEAGRATRVSLPKPGNESREGWAKFPLVRPLCRPILVIIDDRIVEGNGGSNRDSGGTIIADGQSFDSNHSLFWRYVYEGEK
jgi:hypothetical protein